MTAGRSASARYGRIRPRSHPASTMLEGGVDRQRMRRRRSKPGRRRERSGTPSRITTKLSSDDRDDTPPPRRAARRTGGRRRRRWRPRGRTTPSSTTKCGIGFPTSAMDPWEGIFEARGGGWSRIRLDVGPIRGILGLACDQRVIIVIMHRRNHSASVPVCSGKAVGLLCGGSGRLPRSHGPAGPCLPQR